MYNAELTISFDTEIERDKIQTLATEKYDSEKKLYRALTKFLMSLSRDGATIEQIIVQKYDKENKDKIIHKTYL